MNYSRNCSKLFNQFSFTHQEWEVPWVLHYWFYPQAVFVRGERHLWLQGECVGTSSAGTKPLWRIQQAQSEDKFILRCLSSRGERLRPLTGITAPRWELGLSSGSHRKWPKISDKVEFWWKSTYTKQTQTMAEFHVRLFYHSRPRLCQLTWHGMRAGPQQESHLLHPCHWTKSGDGLWVSKVSCGSVKSYLLYVWGSFVFASSQAQNAHGAVVAEI